MNLHQPGCDLITSEAAPMLVEPAVEAFEPRGAAGSQMRG